MARMRLAGKVVLITGAARGIGAEVAKQCAARGAKVALAGLEPELLEELAAEIGEVAAAFECDVCDLSAMQAAASEVVERFGGIDVVLANAGVAPYGTVNVIDPDVFRKSIEINVIGVFNTLRASLPALTESRGHAAVVASVASFAPVPGLSAYTTSKAAAEMLTSAFAGEVGHLGVTVGCVHPSWIDTDMVREAEKDLPAFREIRSRLPWPTRSTTTVEHCAELITDGIERRAHKVYVPREVALLFWFRSLLHSRVALWITRREGREVVPQLEHEVRSLGRSLSAKAEAANE